MRLHHVLWHGVLVASLTFGCGGGEREDDDDSGSAGTTTGGTTTSGGSGGGGTGEGFGSCFSACNSAIGETLACASGTDMTSQAACESKVAETCDDVAAIEFVQGCEFCDDGCAPSWY